MKKKSRGHRSECATNGSMAICRGDTRPARVRRKETIDALKNGGTGTIQITARDAHVLKMVFETIDRSPEHVYAYTSKNPNIARLLERLKPQICDWCDGNGWVTVNMGEGAAPCPGCKGRGVRRPPRKKAGNV